MNSQQMLKWIEIRTRVISESTSSVSEDFKQGQYAILKAMREEILFQLEESTHP